MRGTDFSKIPISETSQREIENAIDAIRSIESSGLRDSEAWFEYADEHDEAALDFRVPHADHKHPSSIPVNIHATDPNSVFQSGKYSAVRFETLGKRSLGEEKMERLYGSDEGKSSVEMRKDHQDVIKEREHRFDEIMHNVAKQYGGIRIRTDTGDGAFSGNDYRPHVRLISLNTNGRDLGNFIKQSVQEIEAFYQDLPHDRFERT